MNENQTRFTTKEALAKYAINYYFSHGKLVQIKKGQVAKHLQEKGACFVTLHIDDKLRGCIGNAEAYGPLYLAIISSAVDAATCDYRFEPIQKNEISRLKISISVLTPLIEFKPRSLNYLFKHLAENKPGLMIEKEGKRALFLPQVWEVLPSERDFLSHLCLKAGLPAQAWKQEMRYWIFRII